VDRASRVTRAHEGIHGLLGAAVLDEVLAEAQPRLARPRFVSEATVELCRGAERLAPLALQQPCRSRELTARTCKFRSATPLAGAQEAAESASRSAGLGPVLTGGTVVAPARGFCRQVDRAAGPRGEDSGGSEVEDPHEQVTERHYSRRVRGSQEGRHHSVKRCEAQQGEHPPQVEPREESRRRQACQASATASEQQAEDG
jgi:hypothetical protein